MPVPRKRRGGEQKAKKRNEKDFSLGEYLILSHMSLSLSPVGRHPEGDREEHEVLRSDSGRPQRLYRVRLQRKESTTRSMP